jgi:hypothetical protein
LDELPASLFSVIKITILYQNWDRRRCNLFILTQYFMEYENIFMQNFVARINLFSAF